MASSSHDHIDDTIDECIDNVCDQIYDQAMENILSYNGGHQEATKPKKKRAHVERNREEGHNRLWNDYFCENATYSPRIFRRRFRMNKPLFMRIVDRLSSEMSFFQQRRDATGRFGLSPIQKCTSAIRMMAYGSAADAQDEYIRLAETTAISCLENFVQGIINFFGDEYLRRPTPADLQRLLDIGEMRGFPGMIGSTLNDINVLDRSPVFDDILQGCAPKVNYTVNGHRYKLAYYLTDGIYPKWATFIQSIPLPQTPKASLFATYQEAVRKDVERAFGVLQARFHIVKNPALIHDKEKVGKIMRVCIILHNMIVEDERDGYTQFNVAEFEQTQSNRTSHVDYTLPTARLSNITEMMITRNEVRDKRTNERLHDDLIEHIWQKFDTNQGYNQDYN
ncbi:PREDICTED: uncharacterized protein LOC104750434 [Camelina sativa]|uniref:Uncharacterized protein LOC104750434 n=1 Tax=Camelina sativa TaxID=90675 RepID=A0ABM0WFX4_CAMSA|nr:PREDICTED: uncharacterized protein LOC104750434 [Camelina sativa]